MSYKVYRAYLPDANTRWQTVDTIDEVLEKINAAGEHIVSVMSYGESMTRAVVLVEVPSPKDYDNMKDGVQPDGSYFYKGPFVAKGPDPAHQNKFVVESREEVGEQMKAALLEDTPDLRPEISRRMSMALETHEESLEKSNAHFVDTD